MRSLTRVRELPLDRLMHQRCIWLNTKHIVAKFDDTSALARAIEQRSLSHQPAPC